MRRPFSRKVRLAAADVLDATRRHALETRLGDIDPAQPVACSVKLLCLIYAGDYSAAERLIERIAAAGALPAYARMLAESNFRRLLLGCYREATVRAPLAPQAAGLLFKFSQLVDPELQRIFRPPMKSVSARLRFDYAPAPKRLRVTLFFRRYFFGSESRLHDMGPRIKAAFEAAGCDCRLLDPNFEAYDFAPCDLALVDDSAMFRKDAKKKGAFLDRLRQSARRVGMVDLDHWMTHFGHRLAAGSERYDFVWTMAPLRLSDGRIDGKRACVIPFPVGFEPLLTEVAAAPAPADALRFCGAIEDYNFHRYFWLLANAGFAHPFEVELTRHVDDRLPVEDSLRHYFQRLTAARAVLNFTMRADGQTMMVGRTSDALCAGRLLVQEAAEDMTCYFEPGGHYLEFSNVDELQEISARLRDRRYEEVRRAGAAFFADAYSDRAVVRHLATFL